MGLLRLMALFFSLLWLVRLLRQAGMLPQHIGKTMPKNGPSRPRNRPRPTAPAVDAPPPEDPYTILGVARGASSEQIRAAFQQKIRQYHPDQVAHLGPELRQLAEQRAKHITAAYNQLKQQ